MVKLVFNHSKHEDASDAHWQWLSEHVTDTMQRRLMIEASHMLNDEGEVDDLVQTTLILGAMHCEQLKDEQKVYPWLRQIMQREAHRMNKKRHRMTTSYDLSNEIDTQKSSLSAEQEAITNEMHQAIKDAIERLSYPDRNIVIYHLYDCLDLKDIALLLEMNYHTVRSKYNRALAKIQKQLRG